MHFTTWYKLGFISILCYGLDVISATIHCRDNQTNAVYIIPNPDPVKYLLNTIVGEKIVQLESKFNELMAILNGQINLTLNSIPGSCQDALSRTQQNGIYNIYPNFGMASLNMVCRRAADEYDGDWSVVMQRMDGSVNFNLNWTEYKHGFGDLNGEFFIGLNMLHAMTTSDIKQQLLIIMRDWNNVERYAKYDLFTVGSENEGYTLLELGNYSGNATDSLRAHLNMKFSTADVDNDLRDENNCAQQYDGAWWFKSCHNSHLFGRYTEKYGAHGVIWNDSESKVNVYLRYVQMLIKPVNYS